MDYPEEPENRTWIDTVKEKSIYGFGILFLFTWFALLYFMFHDVM
ncbi:MAG: hypothetical protein V4564_08195 [Pseudomonadota bacterium]|nr:hypothetical protein [Sphingomonas sp. ERG5]